MDATDPVSTEAFLSEWMKPSRPGPDYPGLVASLAAGKVVHVEHRFDCNAGLSIYAQTKEQLDQALAVVFTHEKADHEGWNQTVAEATAAGTCVYDGMVFGRTAALFARAKETRDPETLYDYLRAFGFACAGTAFTVLEKPPTSERHLSAYPFREHVLSLLSR